MSIYTHQVTRKITSTFKLSLFTALVICFGFQLKAQNFYISGGHDFSTALCSDGKLLVWGKNNQGQLGNAVGDPTRPQQITIPSRIKQVDAGSGGFGIAVGCEGEVWTWGDNSSGQIGNNRSSLSEPPTKVLGVGGTGLLSGITYVNASTNCAYAVLATGELVSWGANGNGQLGNGTTTPSNVPVFVKTTNGNLLGTTQVEGGDFNGYALVDPDRDGFGTVYSWGANTSGTLGRTGDANIALPVVRADNNQPLDNIVSISAGDKHCLAIDGNGNVWSWGDNGWQGQTGSGQNGVATLLAQRVVAGETRDKGWVYLSNVISISGGQSFSLAVLNTGEVVAFGGIVDPSGGGAGGFVRSNTPVYLKNANGTRISGIRSVSDGDFWGFLIANNGDLFSIGYNPNGELGTGGTMGSATPVPLTLQSCTVADPCPVAFLGSDKTKCASDVITLFAGSIGARYTYTWYLDGVRVAGGIGSGLNSTYQAREFGTYKVVITSEATNTCGTPCLPAEDEIVISPIPPPPAPKATHCNGTVTPDTTGMGPNKKYEWFQAAVGGTPLGTPTTNPSGFPVAGLTRIGNDTIVYVNETSGFHGVIGPRQSAFTGTPAQIDPKIIDPTLNTSKQISLKFDALTGFTLDSLTVGYGAYSAVGLKNLVINIKDNAGRIIGTSNAVVNCTETGVFFTKIYIGIKVPAGTGYTIDAVGSATDLNVGWLEQGPPNWFPTVYSINGNNVAGNFLNQYFTPDPNNTYARWSSPAFFDWVVSSSNYYTCGRIPVKVTRFCPACTKPTSFAFTASAKSVCNTSAASITLAAGTANPAVPADGTPYLFQWYKGATAIAGQTTNTLTVTSAATLGSGTYSVRVGHKSVADGSGCYLDSSVALIFEDPIVNNKIFQTDTICSGSIPLPLNQGTTPTGGTAPLSYQWQSAATPQGPYTNIAGATAQNFTPAAVAATTYYKRVVSSTGACTPNTSDSAIVVADPALDGGQIQSEPPTVCQFGVAQLTELTPAAGGRGAGTFVYSWQIDSSLTAPDEWKVLADADTAEFTDGPRLEKLGDYQFRRIVTSGKCRDTSTIVVRTIPSMNPGQIASDQQLCFGETPVRITSVSLASGGTGPAPKTYTYRWLTSTDGTTYTPVAGLTDPSGYTPGAINSTTYIAREATAVGGTSQCDVGASLVTVNMYRPVNPGALKTDTIVCAGTAITSQSLAPYSGGAPLKTYQWQQSTSGNSGTWTNVATSGTLENLATGPITASTSYRRLTLNTCDTIATNIYRVTILPVRVPKITTILSNGPVCELDQNVRYEADTIGAGNDGRFEWYLDGLLQSQSTADTIRLSGWKPPVASIRVRVIPNRASYPCYAPDDDSTLTVQVTQKLTPTVTLSPAQPTCEGAPVTLTAITTPSSATDRLIWKVDGAVVIPSAGGLTYTSSAFRNGQVVSVEFTSGSACAITPNATPATQTLTVFEQPVATTDPSQAATICLGQNFTITANGGFSVPQSTPAYIWLKNGVPIPNATSVSYPAREQGIYSVIITNGGICKDTSAAVPLAVQQIDVNAGQDRTMFLGDPAITLEGELKLNNVAVPDAQDYQVTWKSTPLDSTFLLDAGRLKPTVAPTKTIVYTLKATSDAGCSDSDQVVVTVYLPVRIPNAFSPNGDGLNDTWVIDGLASYPKAHVQVFNRWGTVVFESNGYPPKSATGWDGTRDGILLPLATYYYVVDPKVDKEPVRTGYLVIVR